MPDLMKLMEDWNGYVSAGGIQRDAGYEQRLKEVVDLLSNANNLPAHKHEYLFREALTTSDFPLLFGDVLDRQVLASYKAVAPVWKAFVKQSTVPRIAPQVGGYRFAITYNIENGYISIPEGPGLGLELDEEAMARYPYREFAKRNIRQYYEEGP